MLGFSGTFDPITGVGGPFQKSSEVTSAPGATFERYFTILLGTFTVVGGITFLVYFLIGSFSWITSKGERELVAKAQRYMSNAVIGLVVVVLAWAITGILGSLLGFSILDLANNIANLPKSS